jgi:hypothetical protein
MSEKNIEEKQCTHHWIIDSPDGHTSIGRCKFCGAMNEFSNDLQDILKTSRYPSNTDDRQHDILSES